MTKFRYTGKDKGFARKMGFDDGGDVDMPAAPPDPTGGGGNDALPAALKKQWDKNDYIGGETASPKVENAMKSRYATRPWEATDPAVDRGPNWKRTDGVTSAPRPASRTAENFDDT